MDKTEEKKAASGKVELHDKHVMASSVPTLSVSDTRLSGSCGFDTTVSFEGNDIWLVILFCFCFF